MIVPSLYNDGGTLMNLVEATKIFIREKFYGEGSGHDWGHIQRVYHTSLQLLEREPNPGANRRVIELAALLHDIADWKFSNGDDEAGSRAAEIWLKSQDTDQKTMDHVCRIISHLSFKGAGIPTPMQTREGKIVQDADRLDAIGAIGIARAFAYGGFKKRAMFDPEIIPKEHHTAEGYKREQSTTVNHFFEKLLLLKDRMNTEAGKALAEERHQFMILFLNQFFKESDAALSWHAKALLMFKNE